jgi:hypothetical protein
MERWGDAEKSPNPHRNEFLSFSVIPPTAFLPPSPNHLSFFGENETALPLPHSHSPPLPLSHMGKFNLDD